jgi:chromate transport protein ChrA
MTALALGISRLPPTLPDIALAILTGLNAAAVGLIALAAYQLSLSAVTDKVTRGLVLVTASAGICYHAPWVSVWSWSVGRVRVARFADR